MADFQEGRRKIWKSEGPRREEPILKVIFFIVWRPGITEVVCESAYHVIGLKTCIRWVTLIPIPGLHKSIQISKYFSLIGCRSKRDWFSHSDKIAFKLVSSLVKFCIYFLPKSGGRGVIALLPLVLTALFLSVGLPVFITQSSSSFMHIMLAFFFSKTGDWNFSHYANVIWK